MRTLNRREMGRCLGSLGLAAAGGAGFASAFAGSAQARVGISREAVGLIRERIENTPFVDTHEHLLEEEERLSGNHPRIESNDWSVLLAHYINSDLITAGMPGDELNRFFSPGIDPVDKWKIVEPYWPRVRRTGYGMAVEIAVRELYGADGLNASAIPAIQAGYERTVKPGFYRNILVDRCNIESCQVNYLGAPFSETKQPELLMQDISILGMHIGPAIEAYAPRSGIEVRDLSDWHCVIDWWFETYGPYATSVKSQAAYGRSLDYRETPAEKAEAAFKKRVNGDPLTEGERVSLEDHLFWRAVGKAAEQNLPVKIHTGYYAGHNYMPLERVQTNPASVTSLCRAAPDVKWVFMHIGYPYYEELIAAAKHYANCHIDMCWGWILSPAASVDFLKKYLVTAPANKVFAFGGDYIFVEPVVGHAKLARIGIENALCELVEDGWIGVDAALELIEPVMRGNARHAFQLERKTEALKSAPWL